MFKMLLAGVSLIPLAGVCGAQELDGKRIGGPSRGYYTPPAKFKRFPTPVLLYMHDEAEHERLKDKILDQVVYPLLSVIDKPVAAVVVDFCPDIVETIRPNRRGCEEDRGKLVLGVTLRMWDGSSSLLMVERNSEGSFNLGERLIALPGSWMHRPETAEPKRKVRVRQRHTQSNNGMQRTRK